MDARGRRARSGGGAMGGASGPDGGGGRAGPAARARLEADRSAADSRAEILLVEGPRHLRERRGRSAPRSGNPAASAANAGPARVLRGRVERPEDAEGGDDRFRGPPG